MEYYTLSQHNTQSSHQSSRDQMARAINATDGTEIWQISDYTGEFCVR